MFKDEPLNLNQTRTNNKYEQKLIFLYITNNSRLIQEIDDEGISSVIDNFVSFLISVGYHESLIWDTLAEKSSIKDAYNTFSKQLSDLKTPED